MFRISRLMAFLLLTLFFCLLASCFKDPDIYTAQTEVTPNGQVVRTPRLVSVAQLHREQEAPGPRVMVEGNVHDFGRLDPLTVHEHTFVIRNTGDQSLELTEGPTTCKCTLAELSSHTVAPGEKTTAVLRWNTGRDREYAHGATIYTNDRRNKVIQLKIKGEVRVLLRCEPDELVFSRLAPGETASATTIVYSQVLNQLNFSQITPSRNGVTWSVSDATSQEKEALGAQSAKRLTISLPDDLDEGYFTIPVHIAVHDGSDESETEADCDVTVQGKVLRRLCVYGPSIDVSGTLMMGRVIQGQGAVLKLLLKLRDPQKELSVRRIETIPTFLKVRVEPYRRQGSDDTGLYYLHVDLPRDAPTFRLAPNKRGVIRIQFDHPRVHSLELPVDVIVAPPEAREY